MKAQIKYMKTTVTGSYKRDLAARMVGRKRKYSIDVYAARLDETRHGAQMLLRQAARSGRISYKIIADMVVGTVNAAYYPVYGIL